MHFDTVVPYYGAAAGVPSCKQQHDAYAVEKARVSAQAAELGTAAAACHKLHGDYDNATVARAAALDAAAQCKAQHSKYGTAKAAYDAAVVRQKACKKLAANYKAKKAAYDKAVSEHRDLVARLTAGNIRIQAHNTSLKYAYDREYAAWYEKDRAHYSYAMSVQGQARGLEIGWSQKLSRDSNLAKYDWQFMTRRCGTRMRCQTRTWHAENQLKCNPVRGLGATKPVASDCKVFYNYPYCPDACPTYAPPAGAAPAEPAYKTPYKIPSLTDYLKSHNVDPVPPKPKDMKCGISVTKPGSKPGCNPAKPIPMVPPQPTCTPPAIPAMPVEPTCKPSAFGQVNPMWLVLAAGAGALYWYSKKK
jgi:hypothetical protein